MAFRSKLKRRPSQRENQEELQGSCHHSKGPRCPSPLQIYLNPLHWLDCHPYYWLTTRWHVWQPARSQHEESHPLQKSWGKNPDIHKGVIWLQGFPLDFPEHQLPKTRVCLPYYPVLSTLLTLTGAVPHHLSLENVNSELHPVSCIWKECFSSNPSDGSLTCLTGSRILLQVVIVYSPPTVRGMKFKAS